MGRFKDLLIFDIDGTLLLTGGAGKIAFEKAYEEMYQIRDSWRDIRPEGKTDQVIFREVAKKVSGRDLPDDELKELSLKYLKHFPDALPLASNFRLMPGIPDLIQKLDGESWLHLGIGTGNYKEAAFHKLRFAGLNDYFSYGGYACDSPVRDELIGSAVNRGYRTAEDKGFSVRRTYVIGDTPHDISAGKANRCVTIAVATGSHSVEDLLQHDPDHVLADLSDYQAFYSILEN